MFSKPTNTPAKPPTPGDSPSGVAPTASPAPAPTPTAAATAAPSPAPAADPRKGPRQASLIANDITVEGNLTGDGELQIDGVIRGDVRVARLTVGETGHVEGGIYSETAEIRGRVVGSITAKQVRLYAICYVDGDITHEQLAIESGAFFQGRSLKFQRAPAQPSAPAPAPERERPAVTASSLASSEKSEPAAAKNGGDKGAPIPPVS